MPIHLKVEAELDKSAASRAADDAQDYFRRAGQGAGADFSKGLRGGVDEFVSGLTRQLGPLESAASSVFGKLNSGAGLAAVGVAGIGVAAGGAVVELYNLGSQWDDITDSITGKTGIVGEQLDSITDSIKNVGVESSASLTQIGDVAGNLVQSLDLTGKPLEDLTKQITDLNELTGDKLNVRDLGKVFHGFGIEADAMAPSLDRLYDTFTQTGIPVSELISSLKGVGPIARTLGLDIGETAGLLTTMNEAGINGEAAFKGLQIAMGNLAKKEPGKDPQQAIQDVVAEIGHLIEKGNEAAAIDMAKSTFGKSWSPIFDAIKNGKLTVDDLTKAVDNTGKSIETSKQATDDWAEQFSKLKNTLQVELEPAARVVFGGISNMIQNYLIKPFQELNDLVSGTAGLWQSLFGGGGPASIGAGVSPQFGGPAGTAVSPPGAVQGPGIPRSGPGVSGGQNPLDVFAPTGGGGSGSPQTGGGGGAAPSAFRSGGAGGGNEAIVHQAMLSAGWGEDQWPALRQLMMHESGFRNTAANPSGAYGMFQFMPYTWGTYGTGSKTDDPGLQAQYGMQYIKGRYGSPSAAWGQYFNHAGGEGSYNQGGEVDSVPAMLTPGEFVVNRDAAQRNMALLHGINGTRGYQVGGPVLPIPPVPPPPPPIPPPTVQGVPDIGRQLAGSFFGGLQQGGGIGGIVGGIGNMILNATGQPEALSSVQEGAQPSSRSPGGGSSSGGAPVALASMAADMFAPGSSVGIQLATRAIKYAGQAASIGIMGLMETFLPGGSDLSDPSKTLVGRVASGIAGGQPASKNLAGALKPPQAPPPPGSAASGRGLGPPPGPQQAGDGRPPIIIQNQTIQAPDTGAYEREMSRVYHSQAAGDNTR